MWWLCHWPPPIQLFPLSVGQVELWIQKVLPLTAASHLSRGSMAEPTWIFFFTVLLITTGKCFLLMLPTLRTMIVESEWRWHGFVSRCRFPGVFWLWLLSSSPTAPSRHHLREFVFLQSIFLKLEPNALVLHNQMRCRVYCFLHDLGSFYICCGVLIIVDDRQ
jgi:hypothetical protein